MLNHNGVDVLFVIFCSFLNVLHSLFLFFILCSSFAVNLLPGEAVQCITRNHESVEQISR